MGGCPVLADGSPLPWPLLTRCPNYSHASHAPHLNNQKCFQILPNVPGNKKAPNYRKALRREPTWAPQEEQEVNVLVGEARAAGGGEGEVPGGEEGVLEGLWLSKDFGFYLE